MWNLWSDVLGCVAKRTAGEGENAFKEVIQDSFEDPQQRAKASS